MLGDDIAVMAWEIGRTRQQLRFESIDLFSFEIST